MEASEHCTQIPGTPVCPGMRGLAHRGVGAAVPEAVELGITSNSMGAKHLRPNIAISTTFVVLSEAHEVVKATMHGHPSSAPQLPQLDAATRLARWLWLCPILGWHALRSLSSHQVLWDTNAAACSKEQMVPAADAAKRCCKLACEGWSVACM